MYTDNYSVAVKVDPSTNVAVREDWTKDGKPHRVGGPAIIERDAATGYVTREDWMREGKLHRLDGPAVVDRDAVTRKVVNEEWLQNGIPHRANGPAIVVRNTVGTITHQTWYRNGEIVMPSSGRPLLARRPAESRPAALPR